MSAVVDDGGPAFPQKEGSYYENGMHFYSGMTLRAWFAGQALAGLCANHDHINSTDDSDNGVAALAAHAAKLADAMLAARKGGGMSAETDTPRMDAVLRGAQQFHASDFVVPLADAREVERELNAAQVELQLCAAALRPFVALLQGHHVGRGDWEPVFAINAAQITLGDLRMARALVQRVDDLGGAESAGERGAA